MKELLGDTELTLEQATWIARAMWEVAEAEHGVHARELEMIAGFYQSCAASAHHSVEALGAMSWNAVQARADLGTEALKHALLYSCYMLGYADGHCSPAEHAVIDRLARELEIPFDAQKSVDLQVKRLLLQQFEGIQVFRDATYDIGEHLGLSRDEVDEMLRPQS